MSEASAALYAARNALMSWRRNQVDEAAVDDAIDLLVDAIDIALECGPSGASGNGFTAMEMVRARVSGAILMTADGDFHDFIRDVWHGQLHTIDVALAEKLSGPKL
ncbi:hypothetical protein [Burkholderia cepacia]|uniref:hypothetical protein n=1 Tax=Burkholderia cepacia TaxID=292 RepID=UPI00158A7225|nr:hypothetical protein [Burkholderia cepacia]